MDKNKKYFTIAIGAIVVWLFLGLASSLPKFWSLIKLWPVGSSEPTLSFLRLLNSDFSFKVMLPGILIYLLWKEKNKQK